VPSPVIFLQMYTYAGTGMHRPIGLVSVILIGIKAHFMSVRCTAAAFIYTLK